MLQNFFLNKNGTCPISLQKFTLICIIYNFNFEKKNSLSLLKCQTNK